MKWLPTAVLSSLLVLLFSGCGTALFPPNAAMKMEGRNREQVILVGDFYVGASYKERKASLRVKRGTLVCVGNSDNGVLTNNAEGWLGENWFTERRHLHFRQLRHTLDIECSDGRTGTLVVTTIRNHSNGSSRWDMPYPHRTLGSGSLEDGTKIDFGSSGECSRLNEMDIECLFRPLPVVEWDAIRAGRRSFWD
ncbi:hypothetical protein [Silicimonas sp. MF1-12-2]|uniref:hypothetical protein n=1 Tax=Silicimonas sp. MF1-12-2 TaxID=3384793 RepID=UPI0039B55EC4